MLGRDFAYKQVAMRKIGAPKVCYEGHSVEQRHPRLVLGASQSVSQHGLHQTFTLRTYQRVVVVTVVNLSQA